MELTIFDHILVAFLFIVKPVLNVTNYRKFKSHVAAGKPAARLHLYRRYIIWSWGLTLFVAVLWLVYKRSIPQLGFGLETGTGFWIGLALTALWCRLHIVQVIASRRDQEKLREAAKRFESVKEMIPQTNKEAREFLAGSITAGICEETIYRGYLMLYVTSVFAIESLWPAALLSSLVFGLGHTYQGPKGVLRTGLVGLAFACLYILTGSIWLMIVLHAVNDVAFGSIGRNMIAQQSAVDNDVK